MTNERKLLRRTAELAADYIESLDDRPVFPRRSVDDIAAALGGPLPERSSDALDVVELLAREAEPGVVATAGPRYFGYVTGGALPATVGADWLTTIWDQCGAFSVLGPSASIVEEIVGDWLKDVLALPGAASFAITTGCQMAHVTAFAAARHDILAAREWDVRERGLAGSPPITVLVGQHRHVTVDRALRLLGIGGEQIRVVDADAQGRMLPDVLRRTLVGVGGPTIVCASRRARSFTVYAALRSLGREGVAELVDRCCSLAERFARAASELPGCEVLNDVTINQVLFRFADDETTTAVLARVQESGEAWMGGTTWDGRAAIRISVSGWRTTEPDIDRTVAAFDVALRAV